MNRNALNSPMKAAALACLLPLFLFLAGCYHDPNGSGGGRFVFPDGGNPGPAIAGNPPLTPGPPPPGSTGGDGAKTSMGDQLTISFSDCPPGSMPQQIVLKVGSEGTITLPHHIVVYALGKTTTELEREIRKAYVPTLFVSLTVSVRAEERYYFVGGEVRVSSRQIYTGNHITVLRAIDTAGGFGEFANKRKIEVRRALTGKVERVNWEKARQDSNLDLPVYPNDQITVLKKRW